MDIFRSQPLERVTLNDKSIINYLELRSETLKELSLDLYNNVDLSFILNFKRLERLNIEYCFEVLLNNCDKKKLHLKELKLWHCRFRLELLGAFINSFCGDTLLELSLNIDNISKKLIIDFCPNINFLYIKIRARPIDLILQTICELSLLKFLHIETEGIESQVIKFLSDHLISVENLLFNFLIDLKSLEYFTNNCKANLKKWGIFFRCDPGDPDYLSSYMNNYQKVHKSLKVLGITIRSSSDCQTEENLDLLLLKSQGVKIISFEKFCSSFYN